MAEPFPGVGQRYRVDFKAFQVELYFPSDRTLTYTNLNSAGEPVGSETVEIKVEAVRDHLFLVTWQESDKTTVVHLEDYKEQTIVTNITDPDHTFSQYHGMMARLS